MTREIKCDKIARAKGNTISLSECSRYPFSSRVLYRVIVLLYIPCIVFMSCILFVNLAIVVSARKCAPCALFSRNETL